MRFVVKRIENEEFKTYRWVIWDRKFNCEAGTAISKQVAQECARRMNIARS
jgi:hypothetical protein